MWWLTLRGEYSKCGEERMDSVSALDFSVRVRGSAWVSYSAVVSRLDGSCVRIGPETADRRRLVHWVIPREHLCALPSTVAYTLQVCDHPLFEWEAIVRVRYRTSECGDGWRLLARWTERGIVDEEGESGEIQRTIALPVVGAGSWL
jgi:hypothetical protein